VLVFVLVLLLLLVLLLVFAPLGSVFKSWRIMDEVY